jgi:DNA-binding NarL/FixJ family response regulator
MMENKKITVNLVDDHKVVTDGLVLELSRENDIEILDIAESGEQLLNQLLIKQPEIIIMDYTLTSDPDSKAMNGLEASKKVMELYPNIKILMLSMHAHSDVIIPCMQAGIHGYILKGEKTFDIYKAVKQLYTKGEYFSPEISSQMAQKIKEYGQNSIALTEKEHQTLQALFNGNSAKEIGLLLNIGKRTVETHRKNLIQKFEAKNTAHLVHLAIEKGFLKVSTPVINRML